MPRTSAVLFAALCLPLAPRPAPASENWPCWRGPRGDGTAEQCPGLPTSCLPDQSLLWKTELPGEGHASPIIWENRIFTVSADPATEERLLLCLDRATGRLLWKQPVLKSPFESLHRLNSHASSTPATDGQRVYVSFLDQTQMYVAAFDFDGKRLWEARPGVFSSKHGFCSSPVLWKDKVIINGDHDGEAYLVALDAATGKEKWKTPRPNKTRSYCVPLIRTIGERNEMILSGSKSVASYDPDTGIQQWLIDGPTEQYVASMVYNGTLLFLTCGFPEHHMMAIRPGGSGNVTASHIVWRTQKAASYVPSPVSIGPYFVVVSDGGVASCFVADSGERLWMERIPEGRGHSASLLTANGLVYFFSDDGLMSVVKPGPTFEVIAQSQLGEKVSASPAVYGDQLFLRGEAHLFCLGKVSLP